MATYQPLLRVSILGPVNTTSRGEEVEQLLNIRRMVEVANDIIQLGLIPHVPALCSFWHMLQPMPREMWVLISQNEIARSDACLRIAGPSRGADAEIEFAEAIGKPVFYSLESLADWAQGHSALVEEALREGVRGYTAEVAAQAPEQPWDRDEMVTRDLLGLVSFDVPLAVLCAKTDEELKEAEAYAGACHLEASDNDVDVPPQPAWLEDYRREDWGDEPEQSAYRGEL